MSVELYYHPLWFDRLKLVVFRSTDSILTHLISPSLVSTFTGDVPVSLSLRVAALCVDYRLSILPRRVVSPIETSQENSSSFS